VHKKKTARRLLLRITALYGGCQNKYNKARKRCQHFEGKTWPGKKHKQEEGNVKIFNNKPIIIIISISIEMPAKVQIQ